MASVWIIVADYLDYDTSAEPVGVAATKEEAVAIADRMNEIRKADGVVHEVQESPVLTAPDVYPVAVHHLSVPYGASERITHNITTTFPWLFDGDASGRTTAGAWAASDNLERAHDLLAAELAKGRKEPLRFNGNFRSYAQ